MSTFSNFLLYFFLLELISLPSFLYLKNPSIFLMMLITDTWSSLPPMVDADGVEDPLMDVEDAFNVDGVGDLLVVDVDRAEDPLMNVEDVYNVNGVDDLLVVDVDGVDNLLVVDEMVLRSFSWTLQMVLRIFLWLK